MIAVRAVPSFSARAAEILESVDYRIARTERDREELFQLRYRGYLQDGGIEADASGQFSDPWDDAPNALLFGVYFGGVLGSTVRIHVSSPGKADAPAFEPFGDVLAPYAAAGHRMVDPTRFVINEDFASIGPYMPFLTLRLTCMAAEHFGAYGILATVRQNHTPYYRRITGHRPISEARAYPLLRKPIVCMLAETENLRGPYERYPILSSTEEERIRVFGGFARNLATQAFADTASPH